MNDNGSSDANARILRDRVDNIAKSFGAQSVHLVAHSKGGLDSRRMFTAHYNPNPPDGESEVLSLTTINTPHHGTILSDLSVAHRTINDLDSADPDIEDFFDVDAILSATGQGPTGAALEQQTTSNMVAFNAGNPPPLNISIYTIGADADINNDGAISSAEASPLVPFQAAKNGSIMYRILGNVRSFSVTRHTNLFGINEYHTLTPVNTAAFRQNDLVVTEQSAQYVGGPRSKMLKLGFGRTLLSDSEVRTNDTAAYVFSTSTSTSAIRSGVLGGGYDYPVGEPIALSVFTVDGEITILDTNPIGEIKGPEQNSLWETVSLLDDGSSGDFVAGDGIYSTLYIPNTAGRYVFRGHVSGLTDAGQPFSRNLNTTFRAVSPDADIGGFIDDRGIDSDGDGLFDQIGLNFSIDVAVEATYYLRATIETSSGAQLTSNAELVLLPGSQDAEVLYATRDLRNIGDDGPYEIIQVILEQKTSEDVVVTDTASNVGSTSERLLSEFQRDPIELAGTLEAQGIDLDGNGLYDTLTVSFGLNISNPGFYAYTIQLLSPSGFELGFISNSLLLDENALINLEFAGVAIGENEIGDGNHSPDIEISENGQIYLRAERAGRKESRIYTLTYKAIDASGNEAIETTTVTVPHNR